MSDLPASLARHPELDKWVRIDPADTITLFSGKVELGQGLKAAIARIGAEELDVALERVRVSTADTAHGLNELFTVGSMSMEESGVAMRQVAAEARRHLLELAAARLGVPVERLDVEDGSVVASGTGARTTYWELLGGRRFDRSVTGTARPKRPEDYRIVGRAGRRADLIGLVTGTARYVQDLVRPGMLHARVARPPSPQARLVAVDTDAVGAMPGVVAVVCDGSFLAVVAAREDQAVRALAILRERAHWSEEVSLPPLEELPAWLVAQPSRDFLVVGGVPVDDPIPPITIPVGAVCTLAATYTRPYQMHAPIGPSAALAEWHDGDLTVWSHSQGVFVVRAALAEALGVEAERIRAIHVEGPGCYGHNGADDVVLDAALAARAVPGRPVLLKWMRDDEHAWEPYGSPMVVKVQASVDAAGRLCDWNHDTWSHTHIDRPLPFGQRSALLAAWHREQPMPRWKAQPAMFYHAGIHRNADPLYTTPSRRIVKHFVGEAPLRTSSLRSLGAYGNVFAIESFMDELAHANGIDPLAFRLRHLEDERARAVLTAAAERAGYASRRREPGRGLGLAFVRYKNQKAYAALVAEVRVDRESGHIAFVRAVIAADSGQTIDPDGLASQLEGGVIQSTSWTLKEQVRFDRVRVISRDWESYPILRFPEAPVVETIIIDRPGEPYLGSGEVAQPPTPAAIANAVCDAVGVRLRDIPFTPERVRAALTAAER